MSANRCPICHHSRFHTGDPRETTVLCQCGIEEVRQVQLANAMTPAETLMGFVAWVTSRKTPVTASSSHDPSPLLQLVQQFCEFNHIEPIQGDLWVEKFKFPPKD